MKNLCVLLITTVLLFGSANATVQAAETGKGKSVLPDSMLTTTYALNMGFKDRELALRIVDEMRRRELVSAYEVDKTEADIRYNTMQFAEALDIEAIYQTHARKKR